MLDEAVKKKIQNHLNIMRAKLNAIDITYADIREAFSENRAIVDDAGVIHKNQRRAARTEFSEMLAKAMHEAAKNNALIIK